MARWRRSVAGLDTSPSRYDVNAIKLVVARALRHRRLAHRDQAAQREIREKYALANVVGRSESMLQVYKTAARVALTDATVLVVGRERPPARSWSRRAIHSSSVRAAGPVRRRRLRRHRRRSARERAVGHARGRFTGATGGAAGCSRGDRWDAFPRRRSGYRPPASQGSAPAVLQEGEIRRVARAAPSGWTTRVVAGPPQWTWPRR